MTASQGTPVSDELLQELLQHLTGCRRFNNGPCDCGARAAYNEFIALRSREAALTKHVDRVRSIKADIAELDGDRRGMYDALDKAEKALVDAVLSTHPARAGEDKDARDAERYRELKARIRLKFAYDGDESGTHAFFDITGRLPYFQSAELDAAIDAALGEDKGREEGT